MHNIDTIVFSIFLIFTGAAVLSTLALFTRQSLLVAYIILGALFGPWGLKLIANAHAIREISDIGIIFLLFLIGLDLHPQSLLHLFRKTIWVSLISSMLFASMGFLATYAFGYPTQEALIVGLAMMFSSTIIGMKLLPSTALHHKHIGELMISVLLMQDIIAILVLLVLYALHQGNLTASHLGLTFASIPALCLIAYFMQRFVFMKLVDRFGSIREYTFLLALGWCLGMAELAGWMGLSEGIGAFIAGVAIAASPVSVNIAESLKPLRDFFLVLFFFSIGAHFAFDNLDEVIVPAIVLTLLVLALKPIVFRVLLRQVSETNRLAWEIGARLGQVSEFSLLVAYMALDSHLIGDQAFALIQATTVLTFMVSTYLVMFRYATPISFSKRLRRN